MVMCAFFLFRERASERIWRVSLLFQGTRKLVFLWLRGYASSVLPFSFTYAQCLLLCLVSFVFWIPTLGSGVGSWRVSLGISCGCTVAEVTGFWEAPNPRSVWGMLQTDAHKWKFRALVQEIVCPQLRFKILPVHTCAVDRKVGTSICQFSVMDPASPSLSVHECSVLFQGGVLGDAQTHYYFHLFW